MERHRKAFVCVHVFEHERPVLLVSLVGDDWSFLSGELHPEDADSYRVVGIGHLFDHDQTLAAVPELAPNCDAERETIGASWIRIPTPADEA
jgi:hypothetical protein